MKKIILSGLLVFLFSVSLFASSIVKVGLWGDLCVPKTDEVTGVDFGIITTNTQKQVTGLQGSFIYSRTEKMVGLQHSSVCSADTVEGMQWGYFNRARNKLTGLQAGVVNVADSMTGVQIGFWNVADNMVQGLQIGIINIIRNSSLPFMVILNAKF